MGVALDPEGRNRGRVIQNAGSGERIVVVTTAADTGGELFAFELFLRPGGRVPAAHAHPEQEERFTVMEGEVRFRVGARARIAGPGEVVTVPKGASHRFVNVGAGTAHLLVEVAPALDMEELLATASRLSVPRPLDLALFLQEFHREIKVPFLPARLAAAMIAPVAWLARWLGRDVHYRALRG
jgi:quercetin dioxygenase-like cupin family protein